MLTWEGTKRWRLNNFLTESRPIQARCAQGDSKHVKARAWEKQLPSQALALGPRGGSLRAEDGREAEAAILQHIRTFVRLFNQPPTYVSCEGTLQV